MLDATSTDNNAHDIDPRPPKRPRLDIIQQKDTADSEANSAGTPATTRSSGSPLNLNEGEYRASSVLANRIGSLALRHVKATSPLRYTPPPEELHQFLVDTSILPTASARTFPGSHNHKKRLHVSSPTPISETSSQHSGRDRQSPSTLLRRAKVAIEGPYPTDKKGARTHKNASTSNLKSNINSNNDNEESISVASGSKSAVEGQERFEKLMQKLSEGTLPTYTLDDVFASILSQHVWKTKLHREDMTLSRLHRIYSEHDDDEVTESLLKHGLLKGTVEKYHQRFESAIGQTPETTLKLTQLDNTLSKMMHTEDPLIDWAVAVISTIMHLRFTETWVHVKKSKLGRQLHEAAFQELYKDQFDEWDADEKADQLRHWIKQQEKLTVSRNQIQKLYKTFGATVLLEANELRPAFENSEAPSRTGPFAIIVKHIGLTYRPALKETGYLLLFQAKYWEGDLENKDVDDADQLYCEWVTRCHSAASKILVSIIKGIVGEATAKWVNQFLESRRPDGFLDDDNNNNEGRK